jgi:hypothetical protein
MLFSEAVRWCADRGASWVFGEVPQTNLFQIVLRARGEEIALCGNHPTEWGCLLIEAVERLDVLLETMRDTTPEATASIRPSGLASDGMGGLAPPGSELGPEAS